MVPTCWARERENTHGPYGGALSNGFAHARGFRLGGHLGHRYRYRGTESLNPFRPIPGRLGHDG
eukprot:8680989-Lingulodinium_polyedra.AAC.1